MGFFGGSDDDAASERAAMEQHDASMEGAENVSLFEADERPDESDLERDESVDFPGRTTPEDQASPEAAEADAKASLPESKERVAFDDIIACMRSGAPTKAAHTVAVVLAIEGYMGGLAVKSIGVQKYPRLGVSAAQRANDLPANGVYDEAIHEVLFGGQANDY